MKFNDAMDKALKEMPKDSTPKGDKNYPKLLALMWSMIAISNKKLDDIAYINNNNNIISIPLQKSKAPNPTAKKSAKAKVKAKVKAADNKSVGENVKTENGDIGKQKTESTK